MSEQFFLLGADIGTLLDLEQHRIVEKVKAVTAAQQQHHIARHHLAGAQEGVVVGIYVENHPSLLNHQNFRSAGDVADHRPMRMARNPTSSRVDDLPDLESQM